MSDVLSKIQKELEAFNAKRLELVGELRKEFPQLLKPLFDQSKKIESIGWTQYTPYFNDGEECTFSVNNSDLTINQADDEDDLDWYDWRVKYESYHKELTEVGKVDWDECRIITEFEDVLQSIPDDFYRDLFGDHVQVMVHRDGRIEVEVYEHD